jgi:Fe-S cluster biosynthesis and repair protein YggX
MVCVRCGQDGQAPNARRVGFSGPFRDQILQGVCETCWSEWEGVEVKVINEYRLNFMDPQHRDVLKRACIDFLKIPEGTT